jgi:hypothetical protein
MSTFDKKMKLFYKTPTTTGYPNTQKRFELINKLEECSSVFDYGSGACGLHNWLLANNKNCKYEAYDIRENALNACNPHPDCKIHYQVPIGNKYDLVCLLGVGGLNLEGNTKISKDRFCDIFKETSLLVNKYLLFNLSFENKYPNHIVYYDMKEIEKLIKSIKFEVLYHEIDDTMKENIFMCVPSKKKSKKSIKSQ